MPKLTVKKTGKNKFYSQDIDDLIAESSFINNPPDIKENMPPKRKLDDTNGDDDFGSKFLKRNKITDNGFKDKILNIIKQQNENGKQGNERLVKSLNAVLVQMESDNSTFKENAQRMQEMNLVHIKCMRQTISVHDQRILALKEIMASFEKQCMERDTNQQNDVKYLEANIADEMKKLQKKLVAEARQEQLKTLQRSIMSAFDHNF